MRDLLSYQIVVDNRAAVQSLTEVDRAQDRVETGAKAMGSAIDTAMKQATVETLKFDQTIIGMAPHLKQVGDVATAAMKQAEAATKAATTATQQQAQATGKATEQTGVMTNAVAGLGRQLLAVFAVERLTSFAAGLVQTAGDVQDLADKTGLTTQAIQRFGYAAQMGGTNIDTVSQAIATMSRNLVTENGGAVGAMARMNLSYRELREMQPDQAFTRVADAIGAMRDPMERATAAQQVFGRSGAELLPAMIEGWSKLGEEAESVGAIMSDKTVRDLDALGDAWQRTWLGMKGAVAGVLADLLSAGSALRDYTSQASAWVPPRWLQAAGNVAFAPLAFTRDGLREGATQAEWMRWQSGTSTPQGYGDGGWSRVIDQSRGRGFGVSSVEDLLAITIPEPVIQSRTRLAKATNEAADATARLAQDELSLRLVMPTIGVNGNLLNPAFARYGVSGMMPGYGDVPGMPSYGVQVGLPQDARARGMASGFSNPGYGMVPQSGAGTGFWNGRGGQAIGAGIGVAGGAAIGAMAGGDPYASMIGGTASAVGGAMLAGTISSTVALGAATMGIGAAAVGVYMLAKHFMTVSKETKQARQDILEYQQELWKTATRTQMNEAAGDDWAATMIVVRDAYDRMGLSAAEAEMQVSRLIDDRNPEAARAAMQRITSVVNDFRDALQAANTEMSDLLAQAAQIGTRLPQTLLDQLQALKDRGDLTDANAAMLAQLQGADALNYARFEERATARGLDRNALGQGFAQYRSDALAQGIVDDVTLFREGGVEMGTILHGMRQDFSSLVQDALRAGTTLPQNLQPWITELQNAGLLVDENGEKLTDLSRLSWGETLQTTTQQLIDSIQELVDTLNGPLTRALDTIGGKVVRPTVDLQVNGGDSSLWDGGSRGGPESRGGGEYGAAGGVVTPRGVVYAAQGFIPRGTDTVPAMLTPGEGVLSRRGVAMLGALNSGSAGGGAGLDYDRLAAAMTRAMKSAGVGSMRIDGREMSDALTPHIGPSLRFSGAWR